MAQTTSLVFNGGVIPSPSPAPAGSGKAKLLKIGEISIVEQEVQVTKKVICDPDSVTTVAPFMEVLTSARLAELISANSILVLDDGTVQYLMADATVVVEDGTSVCTSVNFLGLSLEDRAKALYPCTRVTDELTLQQVLEVGEPVKTSFDLAKAYPEDTEAGTLIDKLEIEDNSTDPDWRPMLEIVPTDHKVAINEDNLREAILGINELIDGIIETIDEMDVDSVPHAYLHSTLSQSAGDSVTTGTTINVFAQDALEGDCFEFEQTTTIDDTPFGYVWIEPGTYLINAAVTLQWVGNPRGTFIAKVGSVMGENFDFSQEQEIKRNTTKVVTIPNRMKLSVNVTYDAGTPVMGFWIQSMQVVKLAGGMSQTNIIHDDTLVGHGSVSDPLGVDEEKVAQSTLAGNVAPEFDPTRAAEQPYLAGEVVIEGGELYKFFDDHNAVAWTGTDCVKTSIAKELSRLDKKWTAGYYIGPSGFINALAGYEYSDYIAIPDSGLSVSTYLHENTCVAVYDGAKKFIASIAGETGTPTLYELVIKKSDYDGAAYIRVTNNYGYYKGRGVWKANLAESNSVICKAFNSSKNYSAGNVVSVDGTLLKFFADHSAGALNGSDTTVTDAVKEINRRDTLWVQDKYIAVTGGEINFVGYEVTDYIAIPIGGLKADVSLHSNTGVAYYDLNKTFIGFKAGTGTSNSPRIVTIKADDFATACYVRIDNYRGTGPGGYSTRAVWSLDSSEVDSRIASICNKTAIAKIFDKTKDYNAGTTLFHRDTLYRLKIDHAANSEWNDIAATKTTVENEIWRVDDKWINDKYITPTGSIVTLVGYECSDYIAIPDSGLKITSMLVTTTAFVYYDKNKNFLGSHAGETDTATLYTEIATRATFDGAAYVRMSNPRWNTDRGAWIANEYVVNDDEDERAYCYYDGGEVSTFNKGLAIGDSLTAGTFNYDYEQAHETHVFVDGRYSWPTLFAKLSGVTMTNKGSGGATPETWYSMHSSDDLSGHDFAVIALGVNCAYHGHGGWTTASDQALKDIVSKLEAENEGIKIFVCTIFATTVYTFPIMASINEGIRTTVAEIQQTDDDVYLLDLDAHGTTAQTKYWHGHATATGYHRIARDIFNYISYVMSQNMTDFKFIQFIGTQYEP